MITIPRIYFSLAVGLNYWLDAAKDCSMSKDASLGGALTKPSGKEIMLCINVNMNDYRLINRLLILRKQTIFY